ncbi:MAG: protease inhibitor I42 family protein [Lachnospiraceae bacterium]|nr:protease inhibitor I42 family protein [Lachnospiraceae bacterium]
MRFTRKQIIAAVAGALLVAGFSGCGSKAPQTVTLALSSNESTGFTWEAVQTNPIFTIQSEYVTDDTGGEVLDGVGGTDTFVLIPKEKGDTTVTFTYARPWEGGEVGSILTYELKVDSDLQIEVISMKGEIPGEGGSIPEISEVIIE